MMGQSKDPLYHRRSIRLKGYDYSEEGVYFITVVTHERDSLFGEMIDGEMHLNDFGKIVMEEWKRSATIRKEIELDMDEFVVMPNHIHGIVVIAKQDGYGTGDRLVEKEVRAYGHTPLPMTSSLRSPSKTLGSMVRGFKIAVTTRINTLRGTPGQPVWHRNYYEHIICTEKEYENIANYIHDNPMNWSSKDEYYRSYGQARFIKRV